MTRPAGADEASTSATVLEGADDWLFLQSDGNNVLGQHTGSLRLRREDAMRWSNLLRDRVAAARGLGVPWRCYVAPDKEAVYAEHLPASVIPAPSRPIHELLEIADDANAPFIYLLDDLLAAKPDGELYDRADTHWNARGAFVAYRRIAADLRTAGIVLPHVLTADDVAFYERELPGDLGSKLNPPRLDCMTSVRLAKHRSRIVSDNRIANHGRSIVFEAGGEGPTCVAFGESFANQLLVFLKESFRRLIFRHTSSVDWEFVESERADIVLSLPVERFLIRPPDDNDVANGFSRQVAEKRARGAVRRQAEPFLDGTPGA